MKYTMEKMKDWNIEKDVFYKLMKNDDSMAKIKRLVFG